MTVQLKNSLHKNIMMINIALFQVMLGLLGTLLVRGQSQFQTQFQDYDYSLDQPQRSRQPPPTRAPSGSERTESTTHVAILKQINE